MIIVSAPFQKIGFGGFWDDLVRPLGPRDCWDGELRLGLGLDN